jgi:uroporphyrinogen-III synthase
MPDPVVITRPLGQARELADRVAALGREALLFPLLDIAPLPDDSVLRMALTDLERYALVAFVSPNAIDAAFRIVDKWPAPVALAVVGEGSRQALARYGITDANARIFRPRDVLRTDSQTLLEVLDIEALRGKTVLVVRGETGRELLADTLRAAGVEVAQVAAYRRTMPELDERRRAQLQALLAVNNDWIVTSSEALRNLITMTEQVAGPEGLGRLQMQRLFVPHARIAETAHMLDFHHVILTASGDESLLAALQCSP